MSSFSDFSSISDVLVYPAAKRQRASRRLKEELPVVGSCGKNKPLASYQGLFLSVKKTGRFYWLGRRRMFAACRASFPAGEM
jgi:hypothetical protein